MRWPLDREWLWGALAVAAAMLLWALDPGGGVARLREAAFETVGSTFPRPRSTDVVAVVDIDRESLARLGSWPWRRSLVAELIDKAAAQEPRAIAVDILLAGPDRRGPAALARALAEASGRTDLPLAGLEDDDQRLASAIARAGNVSLGLVLDEEGTDLPPIAVPISAEAGAGGIAPHRAAGLAAPFEPLAAVAAGVGVLSFQEGVLGRVTSAPLLAMAAGEVYPGLALEAVRIAQGAPLLVLTSEPRRIAAGEVAAPLDAKADMRLHLARPESWPQRTVPAWSLLASADAQPPLKGRIVLIGSSAPEAGAFLPVAGAPLMPTVQLQAEAAEQLLSGRFLTRPDGAPGWELGSMALLGLLATSLAAWLAPGWAAAAALALVAAWLGLSAALFVRTGWLIDPVGPAAAIVLGANVTALAAFIRTRALKAAILQRFERYVPPEVVARLVREPASLRLDGELRELTALLTDVEAFSRTTEVANPRTLVSLLDDYFDCVTELVVAHGGMVDKIVGDAVVAFFNIPAPLADHAHAAVHCAQAIIAATEEFRARSDAGAIGFGRTRCGIESGVAIVGDVGGRRRLDYTAYGVVVNKAARFQEANKSLGSAICIGPAAAGMLGGRVALRSLGEIAVRGMEGLCRVYEPWPEEIPEAARAAYAAAIEALPADPERARALFGEFAAARPEDAVGRAWLERLG